MRHEQVGGRWADAIRDSEVSQPIEIAMKRPNASRAYKYGPPVALNWDATSARHPATAVIATAATRKPTGLTAPSWAAMSAGNPKMLAPMTVFEHQSGEAPPPDGSIQPIGHVNGSTQHALTTS
jgi:hypothetical protein